jgi:N4-gp56 family major capsid protein
MAVAAPKTTTSTQESKNIKQFYVRKMLSRAKPALVYNLFSNKEGVPKGYDASNPGTVDAIEWLRPERIAVGTNAEGLYSSYTEVQHDAGTGGYRLTEGTDPTSSDPLPVDLNITITQVTATPQQYGAYYIFTDRLARSGYNPHRAMIVGLLGQHAGEVMDTIVRNQLIGNLTLQYAGTASSVATVAPGHLINYQEVVEVVKTLKANDALANRNGHYVAVIGPGTWATLMLDEDFKEAIIYGGKSTIFDGMINKGRIPWLGVEFWETSRSYSQTGALATVHSTIFLGKDAFGTLGLDGMGMDEIYHPPGSAGTNDPLNLRATQAWKGSQVSKVLNSTWGVELRHAVAL